MSDVHNVTNQPTCPLYRSRDRDRTYYSTKRKIQTFGNAKFKTNKCWVFFKPPKNVKDQLARSIEGKIAKSYSRSIMVHYSDFCGNGSFWAENQLSMHLWRSGPFWGSFSGPKGKKGRKWKSLQKLFCSQLTVEKRLENIEGLRNCPS